MYSLVLNNELSWNGQSILFLILAAKKNYTKTKITKLISLNWMANLSVESFDYNTSQFQADAVITSTKKAVYNIWCWPLFVPLNELNIIKTPTTTTSSIAAIVQQQQQQKTPKIKDRAWSVHLLCSYFLLKYKIHRVFWWYSCSVFAVFFILITVQCKIHKVTVKHSIFNTMFKKKAA